MRSKTKINRDLQHAFSRVWRGYIIFVENLIGLLLMSYVVIGQSDYFGSGLTTLIENRFIDKKDMKHNH